MSNKTNNAISGLVAIFPSLAQIISAVSDTFSKKISVESFIYDSAIFPILNFFALLLSVSFIAIITYFEDHKPLFPKTESAFSLFIKKWFYSKDDLILRQMSAYRTATQPRRLMLYLLAIQVISGVVLVYTMINTPTKENIPMRFIQDVVYILFMILTSGILFIAVKSLIKKQNEFSPEKFKPNLENALINYGLIRSDITILTNEITREHPTRGIARNVRCKVNGTEYLLEVSFDGTEILSVTDNTSSS